jgi:ADP-dependent NAD(P)H-hydrate dehydratase / NAD(P)H-hydrate epimerase
LPTNAERPRRSAWPSRIDAMKPVLTSAQTQALDRETEARGVPVSTLMERAGFAVAHAAVDVANGAYGRRAVVVCGKGNNGGDGLVAARYLAGWGMGVTVFLLSDPGTFGEPAAGNLHRLGQSRVRSLPFSELAFSRELERADVAVDGIFGTGFRGTAEGLQAAAIETLNESGVPVVSVDIPSGVEADTGMVRGPAIRAATTVTFGAPKVGTLLFPGAAHAGALEVADIGFPDDLMVGDILLVEPADVSSMLPVREPEDHKRRTGVVLIVAGSRLMSGAPWLVAQGAYRAGAGLVTVAVPDGVAQVLQSRLAEGTFLRLPEGPAGSIDESAWEVLEPRLERFDAVAVGPGLSTEDETPEFVRRLVRESPVPVVADADAINAFAGRPGELADRASELVITPHAGEFGRLFGMPSSEILEDRVGLARKAAVETRSIVVLKGPRTLVALPDGEVRVNPTGSAALATGGTGDVLTGAVATYLARGLRPADAATVAVYLHGLAGEIAGETFGDGTVSGDVARAFPEAAGRVRGVHGGDG